MIRWVQDVPSLIIAAYRLSIAGSILAALSLRNKSVLYDLSNKKELLLTLASATALAFHFVFWIESLKHTSIASSVTLVYTAPIWTAGISYFFLKESPSRKQIMGILLAIAGAFIITSADDSRGISTLYGNLLALVGGVMSAIYLSIGRVLRSDKSTFAYSGSVYLVAAVLILILSFTNGNPLTGYSPQVYILLFMIAIIPQLIGHTSFNWALKTRSVVTVSVIMLGEPIGATLLAILLLNEIPVAGELLGGSILLAGIYLGTQENRGTNV